jgi:hypothetical protein
MNIFIKGLTPYTILDTSFYNQDHIETHHNFPQPSQNMTISSLITKHLSPPSPPPSPPPSTTTNQINPDYNFTNTINVNRYGFNLNNFQIFFNSTLINSNTIETTPLINLLPLNTHRITHNNPMGTISTHGNDVTIQLIPKLYGGKGGFGNNLRNQNKKKRLQHDDSNMRDANGQRIRVQRDRELLQQFENDLLEQQRGQGRGINASLTRVTIEKTRNNNTNHVNGNNNPKNDNNNNSPKYTKKEVLNSHTAIERLVRVDENQLSNEGSVQTQSAGQLVNSTLSVQTAIAQGLKMDTNNVVEGKKCEKILPSSDSSPDTLNNPTHISLTRFIKPKNDSKINCGLDLSDEDDDEDDENDRDNDENDDKDDE